MDFRDSINFNLNTAFKRGVEETPFAGHQLVKMAEWTRLTGFTKFDKSSFKLVAVPCPIIAVVDTKIRESNLSLTITGTETIEGSEESVQQLGRTITVQRYKEGTTTKTTTLEIPRFTRQFAHFLLTGLGNKIFEITNITSNVTEDEPCGGKVSFYGLASEGSKVLYYLGMDKIQNLIKEVINSIWISPTQCPCCGGDGILDDGSDCPQCDTYGYSGYNATKNIQIAKGYDVRTSRDSFDYPHTNIQDSEVWEFVNKAWTQKWWVTPTISEIKRLFAHFYNITEAQVFITERLHFSMPHWDISVPLDQEQGSPFPTTDRELMKFVADSVTPAGVNVFIGFYKEFSFELDLDDIVDQGVYTRLGDKLLTNGIMRSAIDTRDHRYGQRYKVWNGWEEAILDFEPSSPNLPPKVGTLRTTGFVIKTVEDNFNSYPITIPGIGHYIGTYSFKDDVDLTEPIGWSVIESNGVVQVISELDGHKKIIECDTTGLGTAAALNIITDGAQNFGSVEFWVRTTDSSETTRLYLADGSDANIAGFYIDSGSFYAETGTPNLLVSASNNIWYHCRIDFEFTVGGYQGLSQDKWQVTIDQTLYDNSGVGFDWDGTPTKIDLIFFGPTLATDTTTYFDAFGYSWDSNYTVGDNLRDHNFNLAPKNWTYGDVSPFLIIDDGSPHNNVLNINTASGVEISKDILQVTNETISFNVNGELNRYIRASYLEDTTTGFSVRIDSNRLWFTVGAGWESGSVVPNGWHELAAELDTDNSQYNLYLDGNIEGVALSFKELMSSFNKVLFKTQAGLTGYDIQIDALISDDKLSESKSTISLITQPGYDYSNPHVDTINVNDRFRNMARLNDSGAQFSILYPSFKPTGYIDWWWHPKGSMKNSFYDRNDNEVFFVEYNESENALKHPSGTIVGMMPDNDQHVSVTYAHNFAPYSTGVVNGTYNVYVNRTLLKTGTFTGVEGIYYNKFHMIGDGTGFIDALGWNDISGYVQFDNWQTLYPQGWGPQNLDYINPTYTFDGQVGLTGGQIPFVTSDIFNAGTIRVVTSVGVQNRVLELLDDDAINAVGFENTFTAQTTGTVSFKIRTDSTTDAKAVVLQEGAFGGVPTDAAWILFHSDGSLYWVGTGGIPTLLMAYSADTWYKVSITFDISTDWSVSVTDISDTPLASATGNTFDGSPTEFTIFGTGTNAGASGYSVFLDEINYSWDGSFVGDLYESYFRQDKFFNVN